MGFLSSLFGGGNDKVPATTTNVVSQKLPDEIAPFVSEILKEGKAQFDKEQSNLQVILHRSLCLLINKQ